MKKSILFLSLLIAAGELAAQNIVHPQRSYGPWLDFRIARHVGFGEWFPVDYMNDGLPAAAITELRGTFSFRLVRPAQIDAFADIGVAIMPAAPMRSFDHSRMPMPTAGVRYYPREPISELGGGAADSHFKFTFGISRRFASGERLAIVPAIGIGGLTMNARSYELVLKEDGTNNQYDSKFAWGVSGDSAEYVGGGTLGYLAGRIDLEYRMAERTNLLIGVEYTGMFSAMNFYGQHVNSFNANVRRTIHKTGKRMGFIGVSVGVSFR